MLVCTDGSKHSRNTLVEASKIAEDSNVDEVAIIHVDTNYQLDSIQFRGSISNEAKELLRKARAQRDKYEKAIVSDAFKIFEKKNIKIRTIFKEGNPSDVIVRVASEEGFDMIVLGSKGLGPLIKTFFGSVSSAVVNKAKKCKVVVVK
jgi:nucleotide-binding universal stress UspA family protein